MVTHLKLKSRAGREMSINAITPMPRAEEPFRDAASLFFGCRFICSALINSLWWMPRQPLPLAALRQERQSKRQSNSSIGKSEELWFIDIPMTVPHCAATDAILSGAQITLATKLPPRRCSLQPGSFLGQTAELLLAAVAPHPTRKLSTKCTDSSRPKAEVA